IRCGRRLSAPVPSSPASPAPAPCRCARGSAYHEQAQIGHFNNSVRAPSGQDIPIPVSSIRLQKSTREELKDHPTSPSILESELRPLEKRGTRDPVDYWGAIKGCVKFNREFPPSVRAYLGRCADRMLSEEAERPRDVRKTLLWILEFPKKRM